LNPANPEDLAGAVHYESAVQRLIERTVLFAQKTFPQLSLRGWHFERGRERRCHGDAFIETAAPHFQQICSK